EVTVKVLSVDRDSERISLSIQDTLPGPWDSIDEKAPKGSVHTGTVKRLVSYGAFVEVLPGVAGLVHIYEIAHKHIAPPTEVLTAGEEVQVKVLEVNKPDKRLSLSIKELQEKEGEQDFLNYDMPVESTGFSISDVIGDKLKGFKSE